METRSVSEGEFRNRLVDQFLTYVSAYNLP
jgi:hypothetical protein